MPYKFNAEFENNWLDKTLEMLEKDNWGEPKYQSYLVATCHQLRRKPLKDFTIEDLRIMIGQNIGLKYLIPMAIEKLEENIFASGHFYEGDLLKSVLESNPAYWKSEPYAKEKMIELFNKNKEQLNNFDCIKSIKKGWFEAFDKFVCTE